MGRASSYSEAETPSTTPTRFGFIPTVSINARCTPNPGQSGTDEDVETVPPLVSVDVGQRKGVDALVIVIRVEEEWERRLRLGGWEAVAAYWEERAEYWRTVRW